MRRAHNLSEPTTFPGMSQMVRAGSTLYLAGQCALDREGVVVGEGDPETQARQCFRNIADLLALEGAALSDIVKLTCFVPTMDAYTAYAGVKRELFPTQAPTGTTVVVAALLDPRLLLEVEAVAVVEE